MRRGDACVAPTSKGRTTSRLGLRCGSASGERVETVSIQPQAVARVQDCRPRRLGHRQAGRAELLPRATFDIARNQHTEVYIHGRDGRIRERDSYGNDPYPPKG